MKRRVSGMIALAVVAAGVMAFVPPIPQAASYHEFADARAWLGIPRAANVLSNVAFLLAGLCAAGLAYWNAAWTHDAAFRDMGYTVHEVAAIHLLMAYMSGIGIYALSCLVGVIFVSLGRDPRSTLLDDLIVVLVAAPLLLFVYHNGPLTVATDLVVGLAPVILVKAYGWAFRRTPPGVIFDDEVVLTPAD